MSEVDSAVRQIVLANPSLAPDLLMGVVMMAWMRHEYVLGEVPSYPLIIKRVDQGLPGIEALGIVPAPGVKAWNVEVLVDCQGGLLMAAEDLTCMILRYLRDSVGLRARAAGQSAEYAIQEEIAAQVFLLRKYGSCPPGLSRT